MNPRATLFSDLEDSEADFWTQPLQPQPTAGWDGIIAEAGHESVSCAYLICENDAVVPLAMQQQIASSVKVFTSTSIAGHMVMLSQPDTVVQFVEQSVSRFMAKPPD